MIRLVIYSSRRSTWRIRLAVRHLIIHGRRIRLAVHCLVGRTRPIHHRYVAHGMGLTALYEEIRPNARNLYQSAGRTANDCFLFNMPVKIGNLSPDHAGNNIDHPVVIAYLFMLVPGSVFFAPRAPFLDLIGVFPGIRQEHAAIIFCGRYCSEWGIIIEMMYNFRPILPGSDHQSGDKLTISLFDTVLRHFQKAVGKPYAMITNN